MIRFNLSICYHLIISNYYITLLAENTTYRHNCIAQHGQSILIESENHKLLFDVGEIPNAVTYNLNQLGIQISQINDIVISHRHIDHIGALPQMIPNLNNQILHLPLQLGQSHIKKHPKKYNFLKPNPDGGYDLAISNSDLEIINNYPRINLVNNQGFEIKNNIITTGCIGDWMMEQSLVIDQKELGLTVIVGCSHPTIEAIIKQAQQITNNYKIRGIIGGMHYTDYSEDEMIEHAHNLIQYNLDFIIPGHCTTIKGANVLTKVLGQIVLTSTTGTFGTGNSIILNDSVTTNFA